MKFLVDAQLSLAQWLRANGSEAAHVEEAGLRDAADNIIRKHATERGAQIIELR